MKSVRHPPFLPYNDPDPDARAELLGKERKAYQFTFDVYEQLPLCRDVPRSEGPSRAWSKKVNEALAVAVKNSAKADRTAGGFRPGVHARLHETLDLLRELAHGEFSQGFNDIAAMLLGGTLQGEAKSVSDYAVFFQTLETPALANSWNTDEHFSRKPVAGNNSEALTRVDALDGAFPVTDAHLRSVTGDDDSVEAAQKEGRLFACDFSMLSTLENNDLGGQQRYVYSPRVGYVLPKGSGTLKVFAIQLESETAKDNPIFTPSDAWAWQVAKVHASVADCLSGALYHHHARTHLIAEPICVAMHRQLAPNHPIRHLLEPHFEGMLFINKVGSQTVFAEHGLIDWISAGTQPSVRAMCRNSVQDFRFNASALPAKLKRRGLDSGPLTDFPFRDDALLVWGAIEAWVTSYVELSYADDGDVQRDPELQGWLHEMTAADGGGLQDMGEGGRFASRAGLTSALTNIIYTVSALHSSMNFPVSTEMAFVPNLPFAAYAPRPTSAAGVTEADLLRTLPPMDEAQRQFDTAYLLGESRFGQLGVYPEGQFDAQRYGDAHKAFQAKLSAVEETIDGRNQTRLPYIHLKPSRIAHSINI